MNKATYADNLELLKLSKMGDKAAKEELINKNSPLVWSLVRRYMGRNVEGEDLFQIGCIGLIKAVNKFDESFGVQFSTYAVPMIVGEIKRFLRDDGAIKVSRSIKERGMRVARENERLTKILGREPTLTEVATSLDMDLEDAVEAVEAISQPTSLSTELAGEDGGFLLEDTLFSKDNEEEIVEKISLFEMVSKLKETEKKIIFLRYYRGKTQKEVAEEIGISQVQVSRMERRILKEMRSGL